MTRTEFEHIAAQLRQRVLKVGLDFFGNQEDAEDAAQETMVQLWRYCEHIDAERNVETLAVKMAKNCCISMYRKRHHAEEVTIPCKEGTLMEQAQCYLEQKRNQPKTYSIIKRLLYENQQ